MLYTVTYNKLGSPFKKTLKKVKADGIVEHNLSRFFILEDESRIEIPIENTIFTFSKERFYTIKSNMEREAGQSIITK